MESFQTLMYDWVRGFVVVVVVVAVAVLDVDVDVDEMENPFEEAEAVNGFEDGTHMLDDAVDGFEDSTDLFDDSRRCYQRWR